MIALVLSGIAALIIGFGLKKIKPVAGGLLCAVVYFAVSACGLSALARGLNAAAGGDPTAAMVSAVFTEGIFAAAIWVVTALVIFGIRKLR